MQPVGSAAHDENLKAQIVADVNVQCGAHLFTQLMLKLGQPFAEVAHVVVVVTNVSVPTASTASRTLARPTSARDKSRNSSDRVPPRSRTRASTSRSSELSMATPNRTKGSFIRMRLPPFGAEMVDQS